MLSQRWFGLVLASALAANFAEAYPTLSVYPLGLNGSNNREWAVDVALDPVLGISSMAVELAFAVDESELVGIDVNSSIWWAENPGFNPFTGTITEGLWLDLIGERAFGAFGSVVITNFDPVRLFTIETLGGGKTTLRYGTAASGNPEMGNVIVQEGSLRHEYTGSVTVPEPATGVILVLAMALFASCKSRRRFNA